MSKRWANLARTRTRTLARTRTRAWASGAAICALMATGCAAEGDAATDGDAVRLTLGSLPALTGGVASYGTSFDEATNLAVEVAEEAAKEAGLDLKIDVVTADTASDAQGAVSAARKVVREGASCIVGPVTTAESLPVAQAVTNPEGVPLLVGSVTSLPFRTALEEGPAFRIIAGDDKQADVLVSVIEEELKGLDGKTVTVAGRNDPYGQGLTSAASELLEEAGAHVEGPILYDPEQTSYDSEAAKIVAGDPDAYLVVDFPDTYAQVGAALVRTGDFDPSRLFISSALATTPIGANIPPDSIVGATGERQGSPNDATHTEAFRERFDSTSDVDRAPFTEQTFDGALICILAAVSADASDPRAIADQVAEVTRGPGEQYDWQTLAGAFEALMAGDSIDYEGVSGPIDLTDASEPGAAVFDVVTMTPEGAEVTRQVEVD